MSARVGKSQQVSACVSEVSAKLDFVFAKIKLFGERGCIYDGTGLLSRMHAQKTVGRIIAGINFAKSVLAKLQNIKAH